VFGSPGCWPVEGVGDIEGYRFVTAVIRQLEGNIGKCVGGGCSKARGKRPRDDQWETLPWAEYRGPSEDTV
jgi:hypothetical protein